MRRLEAEDSDVPDNKFIELMRRLEAEDSEVPDNELIELVLRDLG
jgi:hypothetical protein